jgi:hypothetical protein
MPLAMPKKEARIQVRVHPARKQIVRREKELTGASLSQIVRHGVLRKIGSKPAGTLRPDPFEDLMIRAGTLYKRAQTAEEKRLERGVLDFRSFLKKMKNEIEEELDARRRLQEKVDRERRTRENSERISLRVKEPVETELRMHEVKTGIPFADLVRRGTIRQVDRQEQMRRAKTQIIQWLEQAGHILMEAESGAIPVRERILNLSKDVDRIVYEKLMR